MLFTFVIRKWQERRDSNPQPPVLETGALPLSYAPADWDGASGNRIAAGTQVSVQLTPAARRYRGGHETGAGDGNRTLTASLEGWNSTVELHPLVTQNLSVFGCACKSRFSPRGTGGASFRPITRPAEQTPAATVPQHRPHRKRHAPQETAPPPPAAG